MQPARQPAVAISVKIPTTITGWLASPVPFRFKGQEWPLLFTHRAMLLCERLSGENLLRYAMIQPSAILLRSMLFSVLSAAGAPVSIEEAGSALGRSLPVVRHAVTRAWIASMPDPEPPPEPAVREGDPPPRKKNENVTWADIWATSRYELGLQFEEWLDLTPRLFLALENARLRKMQREELLNAMIAAQIENWSYHAPKRATSVEKFMLHPYVKTAEDITFEESNGMWTAEDEKYCTGEYVMGMVALRKAEAINSMQRRR